MAHMDADQDFAAILRGSGNRMTGPRRRVWEVVRLADRHLTAEEIAAKVHVNDPTVNLASVYRALALFSDLELVRESNLGAGDAARWELAHPDEHFHLVCRRCGAVDHHVGRLVEEIREHLAGGHQFHAENVELVVTGLCRRCAVKSEQPITH